MINTDDFYHDLGIVPNFISLLYEDLEISIKNNDFYKSPHGQNRSDFKNQRLKDMIKKVVPFEISDMGFFRNPPRSMYPMHVDSERLLSLNILMTEPDDLYVVEYYYEQDSKFCRGPIPYRQNIPLILNTKQRHSIKNLHDSKTRYICSIGNTTIPYHEAVKLCVSNIKNFTD